MPLRGGVGEGRVFRNRNKGAAQTADRARREEAALLDGVVEHRDRGGRTGRADVRQAERLQDFADAVADRRSRSQRKVDDAELGVQAFRDFATDQLADAGNAERRRFDLFRQIGEGQFLTAFFRGGDAATERAVDDARARNADVDRRFRFADAHIRAGHKRVVFRNVRENDELRGGETDVRGVGVRNVQNDVAEAVQRVHIDAGFAGRGVDRGANALRRVQNFRKRVDDRLRAVGNPFVNEGREAADKVDAAVFGGVVERFREFQRGRFSVSGEENRGRRNGETFVRDRNAVFRADFVANVDEVFRAGNDLMVNLLTHQVDVRPGAVVEV